MQTEVEDRYGDLEKSISDVREMAQVLSQLMAHVESGRVAWGPCLFAVYHLAELANTLHARYHDEGAANVLETANASQAAQRLDEDEKGICNTETPSGPQEMLIVSEPGLFMSERETYLGDGLYASFDGLHRCANFSQNRTLGFDDSLLGGTR